MFKNKPLFVIAVITVCALAIAALSHFTNGLPQKALSTIAHPVQEIFSKVTSPITGFFDGASSKQLKSENETLRKKVDELTIENRTAEEYISENKRLQELLHLRDELVNKETVVARVTALDWDNFSQSITINRGSNDGININDAVVSTLGVIGRVTEVTAGSAIVTTLLSPKHSLGVRISRTGDLAVCEGDAILSKDNKLRLDYISGAAQLIVGDIIETSGEGGVYPSGLVVGKVSEIKKDNSGIVTYAIAEPTVDFQRMYEVLVITDWLREAATPEFNQPEPEPMLEEPTDEITEADIENAEG